MRVTQSMYYDSLYGKNHTKLSRELFDVNKQISSGFKIQYAHEDVRTFSETMRLDNEVATIKQIKQSTDNGAKLANQTDTVMNEFTSLMNRFRTLLLQAANDTNDKTSRNAIAAELRGLEENLRGLANTSINGKFIFSGSAVDVRPIDENGKYQGNDGRLDAFVGSKNKKQYNISGADLFLGENSSISREIVTNAKNVNLLADHPNLQSGPDDAKQLSASSTMRMLMGDTDNNSAPPHDYFFYIRGTKSNGEAIKSKISFQDTDTVQTLLDSIATAYGNTGDNKVVDVSMNGDGQIVVKDLLDGSSKLDFHMVGAVDFNDGGAADVTDIDNLDGGETNFNTVLTGANKLFVKEFVKSGFQPAAGAATNIEGLVYDRTQFKVSGSDITSNVAQVRRDNNAFAQPSTKLSEVFDLSQGNAGTLDGTVLNLDGKDINGNNYSYQIVLDENDPANAAKNGSYFTPDNGATKYYIYDMDPDGRKAVPADEMTYAQLLDVMNMVVTNNLPATGTSATDYDNAAKASKTEGRSYLSYDGKVAFKDLLHGVTKATIALSDSNSDDFSAGAPASVATFNANDALMIRDPKNDFFQSIDDMIRSVEEYKTYPDVTTGDPRVIGMEGAIGRFDALQDHVLSMHSRVGAQSNTLEQAKARVEVLDAAAQTLRSSVIDTDLAEASLQLQQLSVNYQALLSTVGKVSQLSLINYL